MNMRNVLRLSVWTAIIVAGALVATGAAQSSSSDQGSASGKMGASNSGLGAMEKQFMKKAAAGGEAEVELGQLATEKASNDDVKKFGQRMVDDHSKANQQLKELASSKGIDLPSGLNAKAKATKDRLSQLSGEQFDRAYMKDMVDDHTKDVAEFKHASKMAKDAEVKNFAAQTLPTLEDHLKQAQSIVPKGEASQAKK